ncbi:OsmC family protein [Snodgrassella sp. CFCC 13594]|uniref:OsmC family protein n=1 Tax=Snodgrassella sp. CFCC 13594 TaxID=1775559 RepID=UPI00082D4358|nr:OsmC family protein [Snodgrassella sp. CFCC 13594]
MKVQAQWVDGLCFVGSTEQGHSVVMDGASPEEGKRGISPMAMLLLGAAGCSSIDVVSIAKKQRQDVRDCICTVEGTRADAIPKVFTAIHLHFKVLGHQLDEHAVAKAVQLSAEKYCSASIMLSKATQVSHSFECVEVVA